MSQKKVYIDKSHQFATFEQSKRLIELGVINTNPFYYIHKIGDRYDYCNWKVSFDTCVPTYTLIDILAALPEKIEYMNEEWELSSDLERIGYQNCKLDNVRLYSEFVHKYDCITHAYAELLVSVYSDKEIKIKSR